METSSLTVLDIVDNPKNLNILEVEANTLPATLEDADLAVINGNFASLPACLRLPMLSSWSLPIPCPARSSRLCGGSPRRYRGRLVTALASCLQSDKVKEYMLNSEKYAGGVIPAF